MFAILETENIVQVGDKTRLDASKSCGANFDIYDFNLVEISPDEGQEFLKCFEEGDLRYLDWQYSSAGNALVTLRLTKGEEVATTTKAIKIVTAEEDGLFSDDSDLKEFETDIDRYLVRGRVSYIDKHRAAKREILRVLKNDGYDVDDLDEENLRSWSTYLALSIIFGEENTGFGVGGDSYFREKSENYKIKADKAYFDAISEEESNDPSGIGSADLVRV